MARLLATPQSLAALRGTDYDPTDEAAVLGLHAASDAVRRYCGRDFGFVADDEITLDGSGKVTLILPEFPVWEVAEVVLVDGATETEVDLETVAVDRDAGVLYWIGGRFPLGKANVRVTYSHGFVLPGEGEPNPNPLGVQPLPADLEQAVLQMAMDSRTGGRPVESETIGSYSVTYAEGASGATTTATVAGVLEAHRAVRLR